MSERLAVSTRKGLFFVSNDDGQWHITSHAFLGDNVSISLVDRRGGANTVYAALDHGHFGAKLHRSLDGGATWAECGTPAFPKRPEGMEVRNTPEMGVPEAPWKLMQFWALETGGPDQPGVLWAGTIPGGLFRSDDGGDTWELCRPLWDDDRRRAWFGGGADWPGIHSILVDPRDSGHVRIGVSCGGVWETRDGGATWDTCAKGMIARFMPEALWHEENVQDPHRVVQCAASPDTLWCQHHNGVFRTTDGAASWAEIAEVTPSVFGFAVAVHPTEPDTAWFVPAIKDEKRIPVDGKVVVARTRDGGRSFEMLGAGLPRERAYDITFRHGLDVSADGRTVAFGSTTGSLWVSDDQGDSWQTISEHLPPIYAVRFV